MRYFKFSLLIVTVLTISTFSATAQSDVETKKNIIGLGVKIYQLLPNDFLNSLTYNIEYQRAVSKHIALEATFEYYRYNVEYPSSYSNAKSFRPIVGINYFTKSAFDGFYLDIKGGYTFYSYSIAIPQINGGVEVSNGERSTFYYGVQSGYMFNFIKHLPTNIYFSVGSGTGVSAPSWNNNLNACFGITQSFSF